MFLSRRSHCQEFFTKIDAEEDFGPKSSFSVDLPSDHLQTLLVDVRAERPVDVVVVPVSKGPQNLLKLPALCTRKSVSKSLFLCILNPLDVHNFSGYKLTVIDAEVAQRYSPAELGDMFLNGAAAGGMGHSKHNQIALKISEYR